MRSHWRANLSLLLPVALLLTLTPLVYANPPDPAWVLGFWDDKDFDDVVGHITSAAALLQVPATCEHRVPRPQGLTSAAAEPQASGLSVPRPPSCPRGPPNPLVQRRVDLAALRGA